MSPEGECAENYNECGDLSGFDADVEGDDFAEEIHTFSDGNLLETGGQAEAMDESKNKDSAEEVWRFHIEIFLEAVEVVETFVANGERDDGIDKEVVGLNAEECCAD